MWSHIVICMLVGFTFASTNPGWKDNSEYVYKVRGRTLASLHEVANQYSGIIFKADLKIQPKPEGPLLGQISNSEYSQIHTQLSDGWNTEIPDSEVSYKPVTSSNQPFQIEIKDGVIRDLIVSKDTPNWEANIIKSIVSQFQLNTNQNDLLPSKLTVLPEEGENSAVFKTMEETITGKTETMYDIHPIPEYILQSKPWLARHLHLKGDGEVIEVVKHKNYSNNEELPLYHTGFGGMGDWDPATNQMGYFFIRDSISRAILTGNLKRYTIQNSYTVNEIIMSPSLNDKQKASVVSMVNVTLEQINTKNQGVREVHNPIPLGNLVYSYDNPKSRSVTQKTPSNNWEDDEDNRSSTLNRIRSAIRNHDTSSSSTSSEEELYYYKKQPQMKEAPKAPLLPYTTGDKGMSIKHDPNVNIKKEVQKISQEIGNDLQDPEKVLRENTLDKFTTMASLIRLMDLQELKQVAIDVYSQNKDGPQRDAWMAFRDAVAESGTGPAFLTIQDWIKSDKIKDEEAAVVISAMTNSVREPTMEYMKSFFDFIRDPKVKSEKSLYDSALLSYSNFVRKVCVDRKQMKQEYSVYSFGKFCTNEGKKEVEETVIPYFTQQLHEAVSRADTHMIHAYIRALGNIGHQKILAAFQPYLEGEKQASQFQRLMMVMAMDRLTDTDPKTARSVLYKIYQNPGESPEVRVAAVYQLMRTSPPTDMLQRIASYTNIDTQEHVNAAVKSSIEDAATLEGEDYQWLRSSAQAARPLLTKKTYGVQHGENYLRTYVSEELKHKYKKSIQYIGSEEEFYPKGVRCSIRDNLGGLKRQLGTLQAMVSSIDELMHVVKYQTSVYQQQLKNQQESAQQQKQNQFSSLNIANLLNMKVGEREQLEGNLYTELSGAISTFFSFDNRSMENLPEEIRKYEEEMRNGKDYYYTKLTNSRELVLSFPTESGLPFLFTYDSPMMVKVEGHVSGEASPQISSNGKLTKPDTITLKTELGVTVNAKTRGRLSFITPFESQRYISGYDKNIQVHIPLHGNFKVDVKNEQIEAEIENKEQHQGARLFHYSTWPYTSKVDIMNFKPISSQPNTHHIKQKNLRGFDKVFGKKHTGIAFRMHMEHERESVNIAWLSHLLVHTNDIPTALSKLWDDASIQYGQMNIQVLPEQSSTRKYIIRAGYQHKYVPHSKKTEIRSPNWSQLSSNPNPLTRRENLIDTVTAGIKSAKANVWDASVEFQGSKSIKYSILGGFGKSVVDPKSQVMIYYKKYPDSQEEKPYEMTLQAKSYVPNTNGLDLTESLKTEPKVDTTVEVTFGETQKSPSKVVFKFEWRRSEERKKYLMEGQMYKECQREMREGNYQLPACANLTMVSNLLDRMDMNVQYDNLKEEVVDTIRSVYEVVKFNYYPSLEVDKKQGTGQNEVDLEACFDPDLRSVNISINVKDEKSTINNIGVPVWAQKVFVIHPVFHLRSRVFGAALGLHTYRPICVMDKTKASTFNNKTYPVHLDNHWTLVMQYMPKDARHSDQPISVEEQLKSQPENYVVLSRQNPASPEKKDVKITVSSPETDYKVIDITLTPSEQQKQKAKVTVDNQQIPPSDEQTYDVKGDYIQIYSLPNGEVKVEVQEAFYIIYDGERMKLTAVNGKFRDSIRGLCGPFNDDQSEDFLTSENCIARDCQEFVRSFEVEGSEGSQQRREFERSSECLPKNIPLYVNVISERDAGKKDRSSESGSPPKGTKFQTRYVESDGEICFTIHPVPVCNSRHQQRGTIRKSVPVHCVQKTNVAQLWKKQIDKGASPDFSHKRESKTVHMELPKSCY